MRNAGKYNRKIEFYTVVETKDSDGFPVKTETLVLTAYAEVKTTKGYTLITNGSDFEKALTRFVIRYPQTPITYEMYIKYGGKTYTIEYINDVDLSHDEIEIEAKEVMKIGKV